MNGCSWNLALEKSKRLTLVCSNVEDDGVLPGKIPFQVSDVPVGVISLNVETKQVEKILQLAPSRGT